MTLTALILFVLVSTLNLGLGFAAAAWTGHGPPLSFYLPRKAGAKDAEHTPPAAEPGHGGHH